MSFLRGMRQGGAVAREISSGNQVRVDQWGATSRTCSPSSLSLHTMRVGSLGEMHTCVRPEASCVPVHLCRVGPRSGKSTAGSGRTRGKQTGPPELSQIDSRSAGSSRNGVATLRGIWAVVRSRRLHDWASLGCEQCAVTWTACDSRGGDGGRAVTCGVIIYLPTGWCTRQPQCCPCGLARACPTAVAGTAVRLNALPTALGSWCAKAVGALSRARRRWVLRHLHRTPWVSNGTGQRCVGRNTVLAALGKMGSGREWGSRASHFSDWGLAPGAAVDGAWPQPEGHGRNGFLKKTRLSVICSCRICYFSWSAQGIRCWEGLRWLHRDANQEQTRDEKLVEINTLLIHSASKQKSNQWMHL